MPLRQNKISVSGNPNGITQVQTYTGSCGNSLLSANSREFSPIKYKRFVLIGVIRGFVSSMVSFLLIGRNE